VDLKERQKTQEWHLAEGLGEILEIYGYAFEESAKTTIRETQQYLLELLE